MAGLKRNPIQHTGFAGLGHWVGWCPSLGMITGAAIVLVCLYTIVLYFPYSYQRNPIVSSEGVRIPVEDSKRRWGYIDEKGRTVIPFIYSNAEPFEGEYAIVRSSVDANYFFIDRSGQRVSKKYPKLLPFDSGGMARFSLDVYGEESGYLNRSFEVVIAPVWFIINNEGFDDESGKDKGLVTVFNKSPKLGMINRSGELVVPMIWDNISGWSGIVERDGKQGVINQSGHEILAPKWDRVSKLYENSGFKGCYKVELDKQVGIAKPNGELLVPVGLWEGFGRISGNYISVRDSQGQWGLIDTHGEIKIPPQWDREFILWGGVGAVEKNGKFGMINDRNELLTAVEWDEIGPLLCGVALVKKGNKFGYLNGEGKLVIPCQWESAWHFWRNPNATMFTNGSVRGLINPQGRSLVEGEWDLISEELNRKDLYLVKKDKKLSVIDTEGKTIVPFSSKWTKLDDGNLDSRHAGTLPLDFIATAQNGNQGVIGKEGKTFISPKWNKIEKVLIAEDQRYWRVFCCQTNKSHWEDRANMKLNSWRIRLRRNTIPGSYNVFRCQVWDDQGKRIWRSRPYSPWVFGFAVGILLVTAVFFGVWLAKVRASGAYRCSKRK